MIARELGRAPSMVSRELSRGTVRRKSRYRASEAQVLADQRARRPKARRLALDDRLREHVQNQLHAKDSPEQISWRLRLLFHNDPSMRVSHETIYRILYVQAAMVEAMSRLPQSLRRTLTWDQGQEMTTMQPSRRLTSSISASATRTRPGNEGQMRNTNGLLPTGLRARAAHATTALRTTSARLASLRVSVESDVRIGVARYR